MTQGQTSLAQQLNQLKAQQKDEINLPSRAKISFLFDIKQAANIDDQTLFYICQSGVAALEPALDLSTFQSDILNERSLSFYRGTETVETLKPIDERLELLIKLLAPHALDSGCHKILEYLIRIYEVHVHQKTLLLNAFLPYFETAYFLRITQLLSLEGDPEYEFLHQFAHQGSGIDKATLVKYLGRNSGLIFIKFAEFAFSLLDVLIDPSSGAGSQHWKFFGSMMCEILRAHSADQNLLFNCLPFISKAMKQKEVRDLQVCGFLAISQLVSRRTLSSEYTRAFIRQTLQTVISIGVSDDDLRLKGLTVLLFLAMYQTQTIATLTEKDFKSLCKIDDLPRLVEVLAKNYDVSALAKVLLMTIVRDANIDLESVSSLVTSLIKDQLKTTYVLIQAIIFEGVSVSADSHKLARIQEVLQLLKHLQPQEFNQSTIYFLKRLSVEQSLKEQALLVLSGNAKGNLVSTFGDQEYSILNALSSTHLQTKLSALQALQDQSYISNLIENERNLVKLVLLQAIQQQGQSPSTLQLSIRAIVNLCQLKNTPGGSSDAEFECLEQLLDKMSESQARREYPQEIRDQLADVLVNRLKVGQQLNQIKQAWIALSFPQIKSTKLTKTDNAYHGYLQAASLVDKQSPSKTQSKSPSKAAFSIEALVSAFVTKPIQAVKFMLEIFSAAPAYIDFQRVSSILQQLGQTTKTNMMKSTFMQQLYLPLLQTLERRQLSHADKILASIVKSITPIDKSLFDKSAQMSLACLEGVLRAGVKQKQLNQAEFNFAGLLQTMFEVALAGDRRLLCEFLVTTAVESDCLLSRIFASLHLTKMLQNCANQAPQEGKNVLELRVCLNAEVAMSFLFVLLNDESSVIRKHGLAYAQAYSTLLSTEQASQHIVRCFYSLSQTVGKEGSHGKQSTLPLPACAQVLKQLKKVGLELIQDRYQLSTTLTKIKAKEVFEGMAKSIACYPTFKAKSKLISVLSLVPQQTLIFAQDLVSVQESVLREIDEVAQKTGKLDEDCLELLIKLALLVSTQHRQCMAKQEAVEEMLAKLIIPYLDFITKHQSILQRELISTVSYQERVKSLKEAVLSLFEQNILNPVSLQDADEGIVSDVFKLYLSFQCGLLKGNIERLKNIFVEKANEKLISGNQLALVLKQTSKQVLADAESISDPQALDILLETIVQVQVAGVGQEALNLEALALIDKLVRTFCVARNGKEEDRLLASDFAFSLELSAQLAQQTIPTSKTKAKELSARSIGALSGHLTMVLDHIKGIITSSLASHVVESHDPFNDFMAAATSSNRKVGLRTPSMKRPGADEEMKDASSEEDQEQNDGEESSSDNELLPSYQILLSLVTLTTKMEVLSGSSLGRISQQLKSLAKFISQTSTCETRQVTKQKLFTQALFQLYQSAVVKTCTIANSVEAQLLDEFCLKDCLLEYTELVVSLMDGSYEELIRDGRVLLQIIYTAGFTTYAFLTAVMLTARATRDIKLRVKESLEIDCTSPKSSGAALYLLKTVLLTSLETEENLQTIEHFLYTVSQIKFSDSISDFLEEKTRIVFSHGDGDRSLRKAINALPEWIHSCLLQGNEKVTRKFLYLGICLLEQWLGSSAEFQARLAGLAGTETPSSEIQTQLVNCYLSSYLISQANTALLNKEAASLDKKVKNSLLRLSRNTKKLQQALNEMFSLQIHVEIVLQILDFGDHDSNLSRKQQASLIPLKNNCVQLLNEKMSSYNQGFLAKASKPLQQVFKRLISRTVQLLKDNLSCFKLDAGIISKGHQVVDITYLNESLMAVLQHTCCAKTLSRSTQVESLDIVQAYQAVFLDDSYRLKHFQLQTQLTLTEFYLFEAYALSVLEHFPSFFDHVIQGFSKVKQATASSARKSNEQVLFADTLQSALIKASISIVSLFFKFLNAQQLEQMITCVATSRAASSNVADESSQVAIVLDTIGLEAKTHKKLIVHAAFNAYHQVVTQSAGTAVFEKQAQRYFSELLLPVFKNLPGKFVQENNKKFVAFLKECFAITYKASKQGIQVSETVQDSIVQCFNSFVVKLNEEQLRPCVLKITKWAMKQRSSQELEFDFNKALMLCKLLSGVLQTLREFFVPLLPIFLESAILKIMSTLTKLLKSSSNSKRARIELNHQDFPQELSEELIQQACRTLQLCFKHDSSCFIQNDSFEKLCDPVADLLSLLKVSNFTAQFVENTIKPLCFEMDDRINDDSMWIKLNYAILMKTRSEQWQTRQGALLVIEHLFESMRERYLIVLNDTIPFLSELLEDENEMVEAAAKRIVSRVEQMTGESINDYLK